MTIKIIETVDRLPMADINDIRSFLEGEIHQLSPDNEAHLLKLGVAEPAVVAQEPVAPVSDVPATPAAGTAPEAASEPPVVAAKPVAPVTAPVEVIPALPPTEPAALS